MKKSISYYLSHPIQYFSPLLKEMSRNFDLSVYYLSDVSVKGGLDIGFGVPVKWDVPMLEGYEYKFITNYSSRKSLSNKFLDLVNPGVIPTLMRDKSSIIIVNSWSYFSVLLIIVFAKLLGKQVWLRAENPFNQEMNKKRVVLILKRILLKYFLFKLIDKFMYIGSQNKKFFQYFGVKNEDLIFTPYAVDNDFFRGKYTEQFASRGKLKEALGIPVDNKIIMFAGKYISKKRPMDLLKAFEMLKRSEVTLVMVGEGQLRNEMEQYCKRNDIQNVILTGFINQSKISVYYTIADVFVMCSGSGETWGLAVNEAMNFALPIVVSDTCGCSYDLVTNGENGFIVPEGDISQLMARIDSALDDSFKLLAGLSSQERVKSYSISNIIANIRQVD